MRYLSRFSFTMIALIIISAVSGQEQIIQSASDLPAEARLRLGSDRFRVERHIGATAISPDGKEIAVSTGSTQLVILSTETGKPIRSFAIGELLRNNQIFYTTDGKSLVTSGCGGIHISNTADGKTIRTMLPTDKDRLDGFISVSDDGTTIAASPMIQDALVKVIRIADGTELGSIRPLHNYNIHGNLSPNGSLVATWGQHQSEGQANANDLLIPRTVHVWDVKSGKLIATIDTESNIVLGVRYSPDGKQIAISIPGAVQLWDVTTGKIVRRFAGKFGTGHSTSLQFSRDGTRLAHSTGLGSVQIWETKTGKRVGQSFGPINMPANLMCRHDGTFLAWGTDANTVVMWEPTTGKLLTPVGGLHSPAKRLQFAPDNKQLISIASDSQLLRWEVATGRELKSDVRFSNINQPAISPLLFSPNGKYFVAGSAERPVASLWDATTNEELFSLVGGQGLNDRGANFVFSPNSRRLVVMSRNSDQGNPLTIPIWDVETGDLQTPVTGQRGELTSAAFSADGTVLTTCSFYYSGDGGNFAEIWSRDVLSGKVLSKIQVPRQKITNIAFLDDRTFVALVTVNQKQKVYDAYTGKDIRLFEGVEGLRTTKLTVSNDHRLVGICMSGLANVSADGSGSSRGQRRIAVYESATGSIRQSFEIPGEIVSFAFSGDNKSMAVGLGDTTILLYDLEKSLGKYPLKETAIEDCWKTLDDPSAPKAWEVMRLMASKQADTVPYIKERVPAVIVKRADLTQIKKWIADLDSTRFAVRELAMKELENHLSDARESIHAALEKKTISLEMRERLAKLAENPGKPLIESGMIRPLRAVEILERINNPAARQHLKTLAAGGESVLTSAAREAIARLEGR